MRMEAGRLREKVASLQRALAARSGEGGAAASGEGGSAPVGTTPTLTDGATPRSDAAAAAPPPISISDAPVRQHPGSSRDATVCGEGVLREQYASGFRHALSCTTVFEVAGFLNNSALVVESHLFCDQHGFAWRCDTTPINS